MSGPLTKLEDRIAALEAASDRIREETREANSTLKALKAERREVEELLAEVERKLTADLDGRVADEINRATSSALDDFGGAVSEAVHAAYETVTGAFAELGEIYLGHKLDPDGLSLHQVADQNLRTLRKIHEDGPPDLRLPGVVR